MSWIKFITTLFQSLCSIPSTGGTVLFVHAEDDGGYYTNDQHDIFDAVDGNVLIDDDGRLYFIDTIIFNSGTGGYNTYHSLSPRASK